MELFAARLIASIGADGRFGLPGDFECAAADAQGVTSCLDPQSGVGFRFRHEGNSDSVDVPIILRKAMPDLATQAGELSIFNGDDYRRVETEVSRLRTTGGLALLASCAGEMTTGSPPDDGAVWFNVVNPRTGSPIIVLLPGSGYPEVEPTGPYTWGPDGYLVGGLVIVNALGTECRKAG